MKEPIEKLISRTDLTAAEAEAGVESIIAGVDPCQAAAFLVALRAKGETSQEVAGMVTAMRRHMIASTGPQVRASAIPLNTRTPAVTCLSLAVAADAILRKHERCNAIPKRKKHRSSDNHSSYAQSSCAILHAMYTRRRAHTPNRSSTQAATNAAP